MLMKNIGPNPLDTRVFEVPGVVQPGGEVDLPDGYCLPRLGMDGSRQPSVVEAQCRYLVPALPADAEAVKHPPVAPPEPPKPTPAEVERKFVAEGKPPAVAALLAAGKVEPQTRRKAGRNWKPLDEAIGEGEAIRVVGHKLAVDK